MSEEEASYLLIENDPSDKIDAEINGKILKRINPLKFIKFEMLSSN